MEELQPKHKFFERNRRISGYLRNICPTDYVIKNYFLSISEKEDIQYESIENEYCKTCKDVFEDQNQHCEDCNYCPLCKKYGHYPYTNCCKSCKLCNFYGHSLNDCHIYKTYTEFIPRNHIFYVFCPLYNHYFHDLLKRNPDYLQYFLPIYNCVQHEREMLYRLLQNDNNIIKLQSLSAFIKTINGKSLAIYKVLNNNDLVRVILQYL